jgi:hypothetical protein
MEFKEVQQALDKFGDAVIFQAKLNLKKNNQANGSLYSTLKKDLTIEQNAFLLDFIMEGYGIFQDAGVYGSDPSLVKNGKQKGKSTNSIFTGANGIKNKFSYKSKYPPLQPMITWAKYKNIRFRDERGRFKRGNYRTIGFWIQKRIFAQGLAPTLFFTKAFRKAFKKLPSELIQAFKIDVERQIIFGIKQ